MQSHPPPQVVPGGRWALAAAARSLWARFRQDLGELPSGTWRRWATSLIVGWLVCAAVVAAGTKWAQSAAPRWLNAWDQRTLRSIERGPISFQNAILLESPGNLIYMIPRTACVAVVAARWRRPLFAVTVIVSYAVARTLVILGWKLWDRPRPDLIADGVASPPLHSFPSGHIVLAISVYGLLAYAWGRASRSTLERMFAVALIALWCAAAGFARIRLGTHWPSDVIAGAVIGVLWLAVVCLALRRVERVS
jgi:membrane-associated phospholipid phosphatase